VLQLHGEDDRAVLPQIMPASRQWCAGPYEEHEVPRAGHFLPEEAPDAVNDHLLRWLDGLTR
jgi:pimeloyl-ACP methyl ester carboxylesterase